MEQNNTFKKHHILIVDDEKENLLALHRTLHKLGEIHKATSGKQALLLLKKQAAHISVIICDQRMPEMSGVEFLKRTYEKYPHIVRIILTGYTDIEDLIDAINKAHIYRYLTKPWNNDELKIIVQQALEQFELRFENKKLNENLKTQNEKLEEKEKELLTMNKSLEIKIAHRTKDLERINSKLNQMAVTDELTGIGNFRHFQNIFESEFHRAQRYKRSLSLIMLDIDNFKTFNDQYGHTFGDEILKKIALVLNKTIRKEDTVARYGGEEFIIIAPETDEKKAKDLAERIRKAVSHLKHHITVSLGIASYPTDAKTAKTLLEKADKALYRSKANGKNCVSSWENPGKKIAR